MSEDPAAAFQPAFWSAKRVLARASATAFARHGVHEGQQYLLRTLWDEDGLAPGEVARRLGLATPTVTRAAARMEAAGLLRRVPHERDRRLVRLYLTDRGRVLEKEIGREIGNLTERALASLDQSERAALVRYLNSIRENLSGPGRTAAGPQPWPNPSTGGGPKAGMSQVGIVPVPWNA